MGTDISTILEVRDDEGWGRAVLREADKNDIYFPLGWRFSDMFSFLSIGLNWKSGCPTILDKDRGLPKDSGCLNKPYKDTFYFATKRNSIEEDSNNFCFSWVTLDELLAFDYDQTPGNHVLSRSRFHGFTMRQFLGESYFDHLERMKAYGKPENVRLIFWFN